jgi:hypothetical protein
MAAVQTGPPKAKKAPFQGAQRLPDLRELATKRAPPVFVPGGVVASVITSAGRPRLWPLPVTPTEEDAWVQAPAPLPCRLRLRLPLMLRSLRTRRSKWLRVGPPEPKEERVLPAPLTQERVEVVVQPIDHFANPPVGVEAPGVFANQQERQKAAEAAEAARCGRRKKPLPMLLPPGSAPRAFSRI